MTRIALFIALCLCCACQPNPPQMSREKQGCDGNQCKRQVTPEQALQKKPLVYY